MSQFGRGFLTTLHNRVDTAVQAFSTLRCEFPPRKASHRRGEREIVTLVDGYPRTYKEEYAALETLLSTITTYQAQVTGYRERGNELNNEVTRAIISL